MRNRYRHISRGFIKLRSFSAISYRNIPPFLGKILLSMLPALLYSCEKAADISYNHSLEIRSKATIANDMDGISTLDVFIFNDDGTEHLDCYQRFDDIGGWREAVVSSGGRRIITFLANSPYAKEDWYTMNSRAFLNGMHVNLENECRERMIMAGETYADTRKNNGVIDMKLHPLACEVRLNSICCDFSGRAYEGELLYDVKAYLTNVNAECRILEEGDASPIRIINSGGLEMDDVEKFKDKSLIMSEINQPIGKHGIFPDISLWCYQSNSPKESPGSPYTRLVIEGKISGNTYYWPININRDTDREAGVWRGMSYSYDIRITRKGTTDPDIPIESKDIIINQNIAEWKEKEEYEVRF